MLTVTRLASLIRPVSPLLLHMKLLCLEVLPDLITWSISHATSYQRNVIVHQRV